jgi:hypothetical protein
MIGGKTIGGKAPAQKLRGLSVKKKASQNLKLVLIFY